MKRNRHYLTLWVIVWVAFKNESGLHYYVVMKKAGKLLARYTCKLILTTGCKPSFQRHKRNELCASFKEESLVMQFEGFCLSWVIRIQREFCVCSLVQRCCKGEFVVSLTHISQRQRQNQEYCLSRINDKKGKGGSSHNRMIAEGKEKQIRQIRDRTRHCQNIQQQQNY